ncbi:putative secreted protein (Por secretion system target) [Aquimarina sp. MAR_2010_214]|uniref:M36 family metallopeptidase n=1 Tax=Aquimarina sp. MAR_2010_214 TaxID=1250026 RepID=UPI000C708920|nr:M36 family metallopeptidase [Aquimarina sp. MAR_2010_214]PKV50387.1 putative secreted protein (Por secretion system target) [Aquimarina sp. MAR_2010_214]
MKRGYSFVILLFLIGQTILAQNSNTLVRNHFGNIAKSTTSKASINDFSEWKITDEVPSLKAGITHVYVNQLYNGIPIVDGTYKLTVNNSKITYEIDQFIKGVKSKAISAKASTTEVSAINAVIRAHNLPSAKRLSKTTSKSSGNDVSIFMDSGITQDNEPIKVRQVYKLHNDQLILCWNVNLYEKNGHNWWNSYVDAATSKIIYEDNWVVKCTFKNTDHESHNHESVLFDAKPLVTVSEAPTTALAPDSYNVLAMPIESPTHGSRSVVTNPANTTASPYGWHDTNGSNGAEYTITRGNNVWAQDDSNGDNGTGASPDGGSSLDFNFPLNLNQAPSSYKDAAITNLFYWNNIIHDVFYQYGFNEASGNFQENNYGKGGSGSDSVNADAQDGGGINNANFATPGDGRNPRMQMYLFDKTNPGRDGDFDNGIIIHEYGHGISTRLVGGPSSNVLGGSEQMGEGWSDWFALMLTMKAGDVGTAGRGMGTYVYGQPVDGAGIRPTRYSTDKSINNSDYATITNSNISVPHGVGYVFATILWDMTWALIDQEGFDADIYNGTGGNNIAIKLVVEGLKNTANNPGFVSGRDGILQADKDLYNEKYKCLIWKAFAGRGVGKDANENNNGGSNGKNDQTVSFVNPCDGTDPGTGNCSGDVASFPFSESFETNLGQWAQATSGDDLDWTRKSGTTPSNGTGPSSAADGTYYLYVEASGNGTGFPNKKAILNSPCLNFSSLNTPSLTFQYHMEGSAINSLTVEARIDNTGNWTSVFSKNGAQGSNWNVANVDLAAYAGKASVQLRFSAVTGSGSSGWQSDIAIDNVSIKASGTDPNPPATYCASNGNSSTYEYIKNVKLGTIDNATNASANGYGDHTSLSTNLGANNTITITPGWPNTTYDEGYSVWIDYNQDGDFTDAGEQVFTQSATKTSPVSGSFTVPAGASSGATRMRVSMRYNTVPSSCGSFDYGEVEDYTVVVGTSLDTQSFDGGSSLMTETTNGTEFKISPNPLPKGKLLQVSIPGNKISNTSYSIINVIGQVVGQGKLNNNGLINLDRLEAGMYMLRIQNSERKEKDTIKRFIIE